MPTQPDVNYRHDMPRGALLPFLNISEKDGVKSLAQHKTEGHFMHSLVKPSIEEKIRELRHQSIPSSAQDN